MPPEVFLITGASRGIGAAIAQELAAPGRTMLVNYRRSAKAAAAVRRAVEQRGAACRLVRADVSEAKAVDALFSGIARREGRLDVLVSNAGIPFLYKRVHEIDPAEFKAQWSVQAEAAFLLARRAAPMMIRQKSGRIVFVLSGVTVGATPAFMAAYVSAKYAALGLAKALAAELGPKGIGVFCVSPGMTETDFIKDFPRPIVEAEREQGLLKPADVAGAVRDLLALAPSANLENRLVAA